MVLASALLTFGAVGFAACGAPELSQLQASGTSEQGPGENLGEASQAVLGEGLSCNDWACLGTIGVPNPLVCCGTAPNAVCRNVQTDPSNCGGCGSACGAGSPVCENACCRTQAGVYAQSCGWQSATTYDTTVGVVSSSAYNSVSSSTYGSTSCSDHFVVSVLATGGNTWSSIEVEGTGLMGKSGHQFNECDLQGLRAAPEDVWSGHHRPRLHRRDRRDMHHRR